MKTPRIFLALLLVVIAQSNLQAKEGINDYDVFGLKIGMTSQKALEIMKINKNSRVSVGNRNNSFPKNHDKKRAEIEKKYREIYPQASKTQLAELVTHLTKLDMGIDNYQISCDYQRCDSPFLKANNIINLNLRFSSYNELGNFSMEQKLSGAHNPEDLVKQVMERFGHVEVLGKIRKNRAVHLNYLSDGNVLFSVRVESRKAFSTIKYRLQDLSVFSKVLDEKNKMIADFKAGL